MFSSTILDVAIGLIFVFLMVSLLTGALVEALSGLIKMRSATLLRGIRELLNDPNPASGQLSALVAQLYQHALIHPRNPGAAATADDLSAGAWTRLWHRLRPASEATADLSRNAPSYIDPQHFAAALTEILQLGGDLAAINTAIDTALPQDAQLNGLLKGIAQRANGNLAAMRTAIAAWFDDAMDRVGGVYKRWTQVTNFIIAFVLAIVLNINAIHVAKVLWQRPLDAATMESITKLTKENLPITADKLFAAVGLNGELAQPIGWAHYKLETMDRTEPLELFAGWLITAFAALFGAPFWFDMLQLFVRLKSSGPSPDEKAGGSAAAA